MNTQLLIDSIVRQTMVLVAQVATTAGGRTPLVHLANQVFLDLVGELKRQGLTRKVIADMFGLALRSYQLKVQRLTESATERGMTLWEAIHRYLQEKKAVTRADILCRFSQDDETSVKAILNDLVESGLVSKTGRAEATVYRAVTAEELAEAGAVDPVASAVSLAWVAIYRNGPITREKLQDLVPMEPETLDRALEILAADGRVTKKQDEKGGNDGEPVYTSRQYLIPIGDSAGWEAALLDHYQTVVAAICAKLRNGATRALPDDRIGGSTYSFDIWPGHPRQQEVQDLLRSIRQQLSQLWDEVTEHNRKEKPNIPEEQISRYTFYCGQLVKSDSSATGELAPAQHGEAV